MSDTIGNAPAIAYSHAFRSERPAVVGGVRQRHQPDVDRREGVVHVRRVYTQGRLKECAKTSRQRRRVPLRQRVLDALETLPTGFGKTLLFQAARGDYMELNKFRYREWAPGLRAAGIDHRRIYDLRHTYATWSLAAGVSLFALSRRMGPRSQ